MAVLPYQPPLVFELLLMLGILVLAAVITILFQKRVLRKRLSGVWLWVLTFLIFIVLSVLLFFVIGFIYSVIVGALWPVDPGPILVSPTS